MMTIDEMKLAVCEKLPELCYTIPADHCYPVGVTGWKRVNGSSRLINWPTEGLQVCHEAEKLVTQAQSDDWLNALGEVCKASIFQRDVISATYEQRLEALCRVWWPERFTV